MQPLVLAQLESPAQVSVEKLSDQRRTAAEYSNSADSIRVR
jgi:hypothetical protein